MTNPGKSFRNQGEKPSRPPDISIALQFPSDEMLERVRAMEQTSDDPDIRLLAGIVLRMSSNVEAIAQSLPGIASGNYVSLDPDTEN